MEAAIRENAPTQVAGEMMDISSSETDADEGGDM